MTLPTNGITAEVIREAMPPYQLSTDLLAAMFTAMPRRRPTPRWPGGRRAPRGWSTRSPG